jgi:hypothetical protein
VKRKDSPALLGLISHPHYPSHWRIVNPEPSLFHSLDFFCCCCFLGGFLAVPGVELRASHLLGRHAVPLELFPQSFLLLVIFLDRVSLLPGPALDQSSPRMPPNSWDYRCVSQCALPLVAYSVCEFLDTVSSVNILPSLFFLSEICWNILSFITLLQSWVCLFVCLCPSLVWVSPYFTKKQWLKANALVPISVCRDYRKPALDNLFISSHFENLWNWN